MRQILAAIKNSSLVPVLGRGGALLTFGLASVWPSLAWGQASGALEPRTLTLLDLLLFVGIFILIWCAFYFLLYPYLVRHLRPDLSKTLFWILFILYSLTWLHLSAFLIFDYGFYYDWVRWVGLFLGVFTSLVLFVMLLRVRS